MGATDRLGGQAWRRQPRRTQADAADGAFLADPLPQIVRPAAILTGNIGASFRFSRHEDQPDTRFVLGALMLAPAVAAAQAPPAPAHAAGADRAAGAVTRRPESELRAAAAVASGRGGSEGTTTGQVRPAAGRQARQIRRRAVPAGRRRSGNARADPAGRQHAGDSTARQPRRRPIGQAEIASRCNSLRAPSAFA